jgi:hypothetical protein
MAHVVVRIYTDSAPLVELARESQAEIREIMNSIPGFLTFGIMNTGDGLISMTICEDKAGTDASIKRAAEFIKEKLPDANIAPPQILEGDAIYRLRANDLPSGPGVYLRLSLFHAAPPEGFSEHEAELRQALSAVPGWRSYTTFVNDATGHGVLLHAADDKASFDNVFAAHRAWVQATWPGFRTDPPPDVIEATGMYRFDAQPEAAPA